MKLVPFALALSRLCKPTDNLGQLLYGNEIRKIYKNFNEYQQNKKFIYCRYYLDDYAHADKVKFVVRLLKDPIDNAFVMEIRHGEENQNMKDFFKESKNPFSVVQEFNGFSDTDNQDEINEETGIIVVEDNILDISFF